MGKVAFVFPGQESLHVGMGKETHDAFSCARDVFIEADLTLGFSLSRLCFQGPAEVLKLTENAQPAILATSLAIQRILEERGFVPDYVAGHSLGEYSALVCSGALLFSDAIRLVRRRGRYLQEAVPVGRGAMTAILGLDVTIVQAVCSAASAFGVVAAANHNTPDLTVISGEVAAVRKAGELAKEKGARRVMSLPVDAPFHCQLMAPAQDRIYADLQDLEFRRLKTPLVCNVDAVEVRQGAEARDALLRQVCTPVRWVEIVRYLVEREVNVFVEVGPGSVLSGFVKKIAPQVQAFSVDGIRSIEALASVIPGATM